MRTHRRRHPSRPRRFLSRAVETADVLEFGVAVVRVISWPVRLLMRLLD
ncbi:hypothetical protein [Cellulomonas shaoxiangyii]|nr:hypothetical protein [Cellulomonas shaoxiangyii]